MAVVECGVFHPPRRPRSATGGNMELKMRLNVLAAVVSFGFLAAIVLGIV